MIFGDIQNFDREKHLLPPAIRLAVEYIITNNAGALNPGKYSMDLDSMHFMVQEHDTKPATERRAESHSTYTDIQFLVEGEEAMGVVSHSPSFEVDEDKLETADVVYYKFIDKETRLLLKPGMFTVFYPWDVHRVNCSVNEGVRIKKVVVKVQNSLLGI